MLRCGTAVRDITPDGPAYLMGYAARRGKATDGSVHDPLFAKALCFEQQGQRVLLLGADLCELTLEDASRIRASVAETTGIENVFLFVTHTHSAPGTAFNPTEMPFFDAAWFAEACRKMVDAADEAARNLFPARVGAGAGAAPEVARNRRADSDVTDPALSVLKVTDEAGVVRAALVHYACHCTILDGNSYTVSADYPGYLYRQINERYPEAVVLFANGAAGDINIGYSSDASALGEAMPFRSFETAEKKARFLSGEACRLLELIRTDENAALAFRTAPVAYPLRKGAPDDEALAAEIAAYDRFLEGDASAEAKRDAQIKRIYLEVLRYNLNVVGRRDAIVADSYLSKIGNALLVSFPVELFCEVGLALKARLPEGLIPFPVGYAGGYIGYLPTERAMLAGGYESETSPFAPDADRALVEALAEAARGMGKG